MYQLNVNRESWPQTVEFARRRVAADPKPNYEHLAHLGEALLKNNQFQEAEQVFRKSLDLDQYGYSAHQNLGEIYHYFKQWEPAIFHLKLVVRFHPDMESKTYLLLAQSYRALGRERDAQATLAKGRRLFPKDASLTEPHIK